MLGIVSTLVISYSVFTMIYFDMFILTLLLSHIARATPACGLPLPRSYATPRMPTPKRPTRPLHYRLQCHMVEVRRQERRHHQGSLLHSLPHFKNFLDFPYTGGAWNVRLGSDYCGWCWNLTDLKNHKAIYVTLIDNARTGYNISKEAYNVLSGGQPSKTLLAEAKLCILK